MTERLFVYGTLLFDEVLELVVGRTFERVPARLAGYERWRVQGQVYPGLIRTQPLATEAFVAGDLCLDVDQASLKLIDAYEDAFYKQCRVTVVTSEGALEEALTYVIPDADRQRLTDDSWDPDEFREKSLREFARALDRLTP